MQTEVFLDSAYAIALSTPKDQLHDRAIEIAAEMSTESTRVITTRAVLLEVGNFLSDLRFRARAVALLQSIESDPLIEIVSITDELYLKGLSLFGRRPDKEWGLVDCISFVVMEQNGITEALTSDIHFEQAGFVALLRS